MLKHCNLINAQIFGYESLQTVIIDENSIITAIEPTNQYLPSSDSVIDVAGDWISLGGVDLQINGGLGLAFPDLREKHLPKLHQIAQFLWKQGIDAFLPTIVTTAVPKIQRSLSVIDDFMAIQHSDIITEAKVLGVHLEGPFLNPEKRGAHPAQYLRTPTREAVKLVLGEYASVVKIMTLAPELDPHHEVIPYLRDHDITVSLGHSLATANQAHKAFDLGATMVTHAYNAMPPLHHRKPGLLAAAMVNPTVSCGVIADGQHVAPLMIKLLLGASFGEDGVFLVSDALSPIGLEDGIYPWDERQISVENGTARLADGTLAGTTLPLLVGVQNLVKWGICDVGEAIALATETPRQAIGLSGMEVGQRASLLRWRQDETTGNLTWQRL